MAKKNKIRSYYLGEISHAEFLRVMDICREKFGGKQGEAGLKNRWRYSSSGASYKSNFTHWRIDNVFLHFDRKEDFVVFSMLYTPEAQ